MKKLGEAFGRLLALAVFAAVLWALDRAASLAGMVSESLTVRHAAAMACAMVVALWVVTGKVGDR